ncbi:hypothetical protein [Glycomyces sp. NPDC021274]|uniref:hypothetical protein n=1 Tax=Glycomyces sp. NPDC021274 TaxID=3155120 RepID=UPI0033EDA730
MKHLDSLGAFPPETIDAILKRADEAIGELIREELAANRAHALAAPSRAARAEWVRQARQWRLSDAAA